MERIPLTSNGKIDLKALPAADENTRAENEYIAPRNTIEELLASIWQEVLGAERIGILDNFFDFGGDSIKSIQVSSRLYQAGYKIDMKHLFKHPSIAELSQFVAPVSRVADQGEVNGGTKLTPIQHWFFEQKCRMHTITIRPSCYIRRKALKRARFAGRWNGSRRITMP
ncbi:phosphopantetheine-binding protein [Bacillus velezensis]|nr:phosphopantetheine-binding protein [Bacillus velezensis]